MFGQSELFEILYFPSCLIGNVLPLLLNNFGNHCSNHSDVPIGYALKNSKEDGLLEASDETK